TSYGLVHLPVRVGTRIRNGPGAVAVLAGARRMQAKRVEVHMKAAISATALLATLSSTSALAGENSSPGYRATTRDIVLDALESQAKLPDRLPTLPDQASDRAREVQSMVAHG